MRMNKILKTILLAAAMLLLVAGSFFLGRATVSVGSLNADYADAASFLKKRSPTFCQLSERARMLACPAMRVYLKSRNGGAVIVYKCGHSSNEGYVEVIGLSADEKDQFLSNSARSRMKIKKHCESEDAEVYRIYEGSGSSGDVQLL